MFIVFFFPNLLTCLDFLTKNLHEKLMSETFFWELIINLVTEETLGTFEGYTFLICCKLFLLFTSAKVITKSG